MRSVAVFLVLGATSVLAQEASRRVRPTLVKVVDEKDDAMAGARVLFYSVPLHDVPGAAPIYHNELVEGRTDDKGRCRVRVAPGRSWSAWAVWQTGRRRLASNLLPDVEVGRPLRIVVKPFEVPNVRWTGVRKWREKVAKLSTAYVSDITAVDFPDSPGSLTTSVGSPGPSVSMPIPTWAARRALAALPVLRAPAPASREDVVELPPLPLGKYYPALTDEHGGFLDMRYMNPVFLKSPSSPRVNAMYERELLLKQLWMGEPIAVKGRFYNDKELKLDGVEIWLRPTRGSLVHERRNVTDKEGRFELFVAGRDEAKDPTGDYYVKLYAIHPGHEPEYLQLPTLKAGAKVPEREFRLRSGRLLEWRVRGAADEDREPNRFFLRTVFASGATGVQQATVAIRLEADGRLRLPSPRGRGSRPPIWDLFLIREGRVVPLYQAQGRVPDKLLIDLDRIRTVEVEVACEFTALRNPTVRLYRSKTDTGWSGLHCPVSRDGKVRLALMPGKYCLVGLDDRGDGFLELDVRKDSPPELLLALRPYEVIKGKVVDRSGNPVAGARITGEWSRTTVTLDARGRQLRVAETPVVPVLQALRGTRQMHAVSNARGEFEIWVVASKAQLYLTAYRMDDKQRVLSATKVAVTPAEQEEVKIVSR